jgi:transcriptional regulator with XRE-family HTH domain
VVDGSFRTRYLGNGDVDDFLVSFLDSPSGRRLLLAEEVDAVAIGSEFDEASQSAAVLVTSYQFLEDRPHVKRVNEFLDKLAQARAARGASAPRKVAGLKGTANSLASKVESGELALNVATAKLWDAALQEFQVTTYIYYAAAHDPLKLKFHERLLTMEPLRIGIMVTPFKPKNSPWHIYGIAIAYPQTDTVTKVAEVPVVGPSAVMAPATASAVAE